MSTFQSKIEITTSGRHGSFVILVLFSAITAVLYFQTLNAPFTFDSLYRIQKNPSIQISELSAEQLYDAAFGKKSAKDRPVGNLTFALNYYFDEFDPIGYHIVNIATHVLAGFFLFLILKSTLRLPSAGCIPELHGTIAFFGSLIWVVHPVNTQSISYIVQRLNSLAALFFLVSLWLYIQGRHRSTPSIRWPWFTAAAASWIMALGCKQNAATLPIVIYLYEFFFFQDLDVDWLKRSLKWVGAIVPVGVALAFIYTGGNPAERLGSLRDYSSGDFSLGQRILTQFRVVVHYLSLFVFPHPSRLNLDYDFPLSDSLLNPPTTLAAMLLIIGLIGIGLYTARRYRLLSFAILWFFGNLVIESSVIPLAIIFEHRTYLPYMMLCPLVAWAALKLPGSRGFPLLLLVTLASVFSVWTWQRNMVWADPVRLWSDVVSKSPNKSRPHHNLGEALASEGNIEAAERMYKTAISIDPTFSESYNNLALIVAERGDIGAAEELYRKALAMSPNFFQALNNYAVLLIDSGRAEDSLQLLRRAEELNPNSPTLKVNLGLAWSKLNNPEKAESIIRKVISQYPKDKGARIALSRVLIEGGNYDVAVKQLEQLIQETPDDIPTHELMLDAILKKGDTQKLEPQLKRLLALDPDNVEANTNMGGILIGHGDIDGAMVHLRKVLDQNPTHAEALNNMGIAMASKGRYSNAGDAFLAAIRSRPEFTDAWDNLFHLGRVAGPRWDMESALRRHAGEFPDNPESHVILGEFYLRRGDAARARAAFERALDLEPENTRALERLSAVSSGTNN